MRRKRFRNPYVDHLRKSVVDFFLWKMGHYADLEPRLPPPCNFAYPAQPQKYIQGSPSAIWIGHSTFLIEMEGVHILTDPVWDDYCFPIPIKMLKRKSLPPLALKDLPSIDLILISHNHYDHLDARTVSHLKCSQPHIEWVVPEGVLPWFKRRSIGKVTELGWWNSIEKGGCRITSVPAQHFSGRALWDKNRTHWNGYVLEKGGKKLYFAGDTGYNSQDFQNIGKHFVSMDLSLIPIGTYAPQKFMQPVHINPYEAVQIHLDVHSKLSLGMHWNTCRLSEEPLDRPPYDLYLAMQQKALPLASFLPVDIGTYVNF